jgi:hypothetical protein
MEIRKLGYPTAFGIHPNAGKTQLRFHFRFRGRTPQLQNAVEFEMSVEHAVSMIATLQHVLARNNIPIPPTLRPRRGRPILRIVKSEEEP